MLGSADPSSTLGEDLTVREVLDAAAMTIETDFEDYPIVHAAVRMALSNTYLGLGKLDDALLHAQKMLSVSRESLGDSDPMTADAMRTLAMIYIELGQYDEAQELLDEAQVIVDAQDDPVESAKIQSSIAQIKHMKGLHDESLAMWTLAEGVLRKELGENGKETLIVMHNRGVALKDIGRLSESEAVMQEVADRRMESMGPDHPQTLVAMDVLASVIQKQGRDEEASVILRDVLDRRRRVLGDDHFSTQLSEGNLAVALIRLGQLDEAEVLTKHALAGHRERFGDEHAKTLILMGNLAYLLEDQGKVDEAAALYRETIEIQKRASGGGDPETWSPINNLAMLLMNNGDPEEAEGLFEELVEMCKARLPANHYYLALFRNNYGECLTKLRKFDKAQVELNESHPILVATFGATHARTLKSDGRIEALEAARNQSP
jgi:tetratricopeptide (TPR) repeat protein